MSLTVARGFTRQDVAAIALLGMSLDVLGALYLAYDLLGREQGVLRTLTRIGTYGGSIALPILALAPFSPNMASVVLVALVMWAIMGTLLAYLSWANWGGIGTIQDERPLFQRIYRGKVRRNSLFVFGGIFVLCLLITYLAWTKHNSDLIAWSGWSWSVLVLLSSTWISPYVEWRLKQLSLPRYGIIGVFLILGGFILQSLQYWFVVLDIPIR